MRREEEEKGCAGITGTESKGEEGWMRGRGKREEKKVEVKREGGVRGVGGWVVGL